MTDLSKVLEAVKNSKVVLDQEFWDKQNKKKEKIIMLPGYTCSLQEWTKVVDTHIHDGRMNFIHCDQNGMIYVSQGEPRMWGFSDKAVRFMSSNLKCVSYDFDITFDGKWKDSVYQLHPNVHKDNFVKNGKSRKPV
tara:strand:+ start:719 stop:1126 length:408 start_codon:yes stop_codon:yes gene_type:complete